MSSSDHGDHLAAAFAELNNHLRTAGERGDALQGLVELAVQTLPGCDWAGMTAWPPRQKPRSLASSDEVATAVDELQHRLGEGPCLEAADDGFVVRIPDLTAEDRWPAFRAAALQESPVRGILAVQLLNDPERSALNFYCATPHAFTVKSSATAALFAAHARVLLLHAASAERADHLDRALVASRQIGIAVGILMNAHHITDERAFTLLRVTSQRLNRKLRDIAADVAQTGSLPQPE
ncbi:GAF and ANTAR domain-containing protein [Luteipulveratus flavus]|uniref:GAF and ANTAR domain-containing protein n=1 Tax=Luteipulveratus flavus TaxID=3031728 RepID=A0ABT6C3A7_9MICO|nr:GAF and ANTAR domain-containing protein [Luteipulveratus sp. YIM 133296]MDF8263220.1 GAF and ANTAR domain-containing protein [Luteipulveratus sp. YIM 133296]